MSKRTASNVDEEFLINNVHMRTKGSLSFQRQKTEDDNMGKEGQETIQEKASFNQDEGLTAVSDSQAPDSVSRQNKEASQKRPSAIGSDYDQSFLVHNEIRFRKAAYLSVANHDAISRIVKELGNGQLSVGGYLDLIVTAHLEQYRDRINALYRARKTSDNLI